jgi:hypothetical protein
MQRPSSRLWLLTLRDNEGMYTPYGFAEVRAGAGGGGGALPWAAVAVAQLDGLMVQHTSIVYPPCGERRLGPYAARLYSLWEGDLVDPFSSTPQRRPLQTLLRGIASLSCQQARSLAEVPPVLAFEFRAGSVVAALSTGRLKDALICMELTGR